MAASSVAGSRSSWSEPSANETGLGVRRRFNASLPVDDLDPGHVQLFAAGDVVELGGRDHGLPVAAEKVHQTATAGRVQLRHHVVEQQERSGAVRVRQLLALGEQ